MYNPFPLFTRGLLMDQVKKGKRWFVRQTFSRGMREPLTAAFLIRGYKEEERAQVEEHMATLQQDGNAFLYDAKIPVHLEKLGKAAGQPVGYKVFYAAKVGTDWQPPELYERRIRDYIRQHHPNWRVRGDGGGIRVGLHEIFGELFLKFHHRREEYMIPFDTIE